MRLVFQLVLFLCFTAINAQQHCGFDFTSYVVLHIHPEGSKDNISDLTIVLVDQNGNEIVNNLNKYSWNQTDQILKFSENYRIDNTGKRAATDVDQSKLRWFFPFAKDTYFLSVTNDFPADDLMVKITDPKGVYQESVHQLFAYNMYVLCTTQAQQFGRRMNKPVDIVLKKI